VDGAGDVALNLIVIGPPGAGKGTQAERFARDHGIPNVSTGDILRAAVHDDTLLGREVNAVLSSGRLVGDDLMIDIVNERLGRDDARPGFVLDGFPRTVRQAEALDVMLNDRGQLIVVEIRVPDDELVRRVRSRRICSNCGRNVSAFNSDVLPVERCEFCGGELVSRPDDGESIVRDRIKVYWRETNPVIAHYHERPTYRVVNGAQSPERVREALVTAVASALGMPEGELPRGQQLRSGSNA
jgi:adenylate kinase